MSEPTDSLAEALAYLERQVPALGFSLDCKQIDCLRIFLEELAAYNAHTNLVARADPLTVVQDHILDSLTLVPVIQQLPDKPGYPIKLIDIGSGAGFPGLILALALPYIKASLVESVGKKSLFLKHVIKNMGLSARAEVINERAENMGHDFARRGSFDLSTARAIGALDLACELALPLLKPGGFLLLQKSKAQADLEKQRAAVALPQLGSRLKQLLELPAGVAGKGRVLFCIEKTAATGPQYPRKPARMKRYPLGLQVGLQD